MNTWITSANLCNVCGITDRHARRILTGFADGKVWKGSCGQVRTIKGRGGRAGMRYEVLLSSLSEELQRAFKASLSAAALPMLPVADATYRPSMLAKSEYAPEALATYERIEPALHHPARSHARRAAIEAIARRSNWSVRKVERKIKDFEEHGLSGLVRKAHSDAGQRRVYISRAFDRAYVTAGCDLSLLPDLSDHLDLLIKSFWASRTADAGTPDVAEGAAWEFRKHCEAQGIVLPRAAYEIGRKRVEQWRAYEKVNTMRTDAKRFADELPHVRRDATGLAPMEVIFIDVHHMNVPVTRPDGTMAWPKLVGFMDAGTSRIFCHIVLCKERTSIRREHVIEGFIAMATDRAWGFPQTLYMDNGSENGALERILPALEMVNNHAGREIIKALPYGAQSKTIEQTFARLNRYCFSKMPGYAGDDRMKKKTQNVGKEVTPYQGSFEQFKDDCHGLIARFHAKVMEGQWGGRAPNQVFQDKIDAGWRPIMPEPLALDAAFCERGERTITRGCLRIDGKAFTHSGLSKLTHGTAVQIAMPWRKDEAPIAFLPELGPVRLFEDYQYALRDPSGAIASGQRKSAHRLAVREMEREVLPVDPVATFREIGAAAAAPRIPGRAHVLDQGSHVHELADAKVLAAQAEQAEISEAERVKRRRDLLTENLERKQANAA